MGTQFPRELVWPPLAQTGTVAVTNASGHRNAAMGPCASIIEEDASAMGRYGKPEEIAPVVNVLASDGTSPIAYATVAM